jgi:hypothetical protein
MSAYGERESPLLREVAQIATGLAGRCRAYPACYIRSKEVVMRRLLPVTADQYDYVAAECKVRRVRR